MGTVPILNSNRKDKIGYIPFTESIKRKKYFNSKKQKPRTPNKQQITEKLQI